MTLVNHEKLSDCQNLMGNEGKVSNCGEGKKGEGLGRVSSLPFSLSRSPPSSPLLLSLSPSPSPSLCTCDQIFKRPILLISVVSHFHAIKSCFTCDCVDQDRIIRSRGFPQVARQRFGNFSYFEQILHSEQFFQLSSSSEISKQLLVLKIDLSFIFHNVLVDNL